MIIVELYCSETNADEIANKPKVSSRFKYL